MTALKAVYQFQVSKSPRLWNDNPIESHRNNHRTNQEITTEITNNHRNNPLISDKWPFHGLFFCGVPPWENSQELERVQTLPRSRSCRITPVGGSARARPLQIDGDESRIIPGVFSIEKGCGENHRFHKGWSWKSMKNPWKSMKIHENPWKIHEHLWASMKNPWKSMKIHDSWIFNDIHGGKKSTSVHFVCLATRLHFPVASGPTGRPVDFSPTWVGWVRKTFPSYGSQRVNGP